MRTRTTATLAIAAATLTAIALTAAPAAADDTETFQARYAARYGSWIQETGGSPDSCRGQAPTLVVDEPSDFVKDNGLAPGEEAGAPEWLGVWRGTDGDDVIVVTVEPDHSGDTAWPYYDYLVDGGGGNDTVCVYSRGITQPGGTRQSGIWVSGGDGDDWMWGGNAADHGDNRRRPRGRSARLLIRSPRSPRSAKSPSTWKGLPRSPSPPP